VELRRLVRAFVAGHSHGAGTVVMGAFTATIPSVCRHLILEAKHRQRPVGVWKGGRWLTRRGNYRQARGYAEVMKLR